MRRPNGSGTVYKLKGNRRRPWVAAKNKIIIGYFATKREALEALEHLSGEKLTDNYNMTLEQIYGEWSANHYKTYENDRTLIMRYKKAYGFLKPLYKKKFRLLRAKDFQEIIDGMPKQTYAALSPVKQIVTFMYAYAIREGIATVNYGEYISVPKKTTPEKKIFSDTEIKKIDREGSETAQIVMLLIFTGMRIGELLKLPKSACHETYVIGGEKTKAGKNRVIPVPKRVRPYLQNLIEQSDTDMVMTLTRSRFTKKYRELLEKLNIEYKTPHSTRHTFASICRRSGMPPEVLKKIMGHTDYKTTANIYVHADRDELIEAAENL